MKLFQVRKGQFVYYENELHRVYAVKPMYKQSVHLIRLRDLKQVLCSAKEVERYQPKEKDSFIFNKNYYTLSNRKAEVGDYILITNPSPDYLDHYSLNEIEVVASVENKGVITTNSNGIRHHEYKLMIPGRDEDSHPIEYKDFQQIKDAKEASNSTLIEDLYPEIGDVYKKKDGDCSFETMVIAIIDDVAYLGGGLKVPMKELMELAKWEFLYNVMDND
ncbi:MAG: hypothetical protein GX072_13780 [Lysinibacillus sp.]|nr:hypothetical protein [Lysinibacillus sp.]